MLLFHCSPAPATRLCSADPLNFEKNSVGAIARVVLVFAVLLVLCGCGKGKYTKPEYATWEELQQLQSTELMMPIDTLYSQGNVAGFKKAIQSSEFAAALDKFEASEIPSKFVTDERQQAKEEAVAQYRKCLELIASKGSDREIVAAYDTAKKALAAVSEPERPPTEESDDAAESTE